MAFLPTPDRTSLLTANLPRNVLRTIHYFAWSPSTHLRLALTCKTFLEWISNKSLLHIYMFPILVQQTLPKIPGLMICVMLRHFRASIGYERLILLLGDMLQCIPPPVITDNPIGAKLMGTYILMNAIFELLHNYKERLSKMLSNARKHGFRQCYETLQILDNHVYTYNTPYLAWRSLFESRRWTYTYIRPSCICPEIYHTKILQLLRSMDMIEIVSNIHGNDVLEIAFWTKILYALNIPGISSIIRDYVVAIRKRRPVNTYMINKYCHGAICALIRSETTTEEECIDLMNLYIENHTPQIQEVGYIFIERLLSSEKDPNPCSIAFLNDRSIMSGIATLVNKYMSHQTKQEVITMLARVDYSVRYIRDIIKALDALYGSEPVPDTLLITADEMKTPFLVYMIAHNKYGISANVLKERMENVESSREVLVTIVHVLDRDPRLVTRFSSIYSELVTTCLKCNVICRTKNKRARTTTCTWSILTVLDALVEYTDVVFPEDVSLCCDQCTNMLRKRLKDRGK